MHRPSRFRGSVLLVAIVIAGPGCSKALDFDEFTFRAQGDAAVDAAGPGDGGGGDGSTPGDGGPNCGNGTIDDGETCEVADPSTHVACVACQRTCAAGFDDCNTDLASSAGNGCESDLTQPTSCGECGETCDANQLCFQMACATPTASGNVTASGSPWSPSTTKLTAVLVSVSTPSTSVVELGVTTNTAGVEFTLALYSNVGGQPGAALASAVAVSTGATQRIALAAPVAISAGTYWVAFQANAALTVSASGSMVTTDAIDHGYGTPLPSGATWSTTTAPALSLFLTAVP